MFFYNTHTLRQHKQLAFSNLKLNKTHCIFIDLYFTFQKAITQMQICIPFYIRYSRCLPNSLFYVSQLHLCTTGITHYKIECKEKQTLNRVLTRNLILKRFAPFPTHCTSLSISRDSQRTEIRINHYKTTNYTHFSKNKATTF